jgi:hypothetical protein
MLFIKKRQSSFTKVRFVEEKAEIQVKKVKQSRYRPGVAHRFPGS